MNAKQLIWTVLATWFAAVFALGAAGAFTTAPGQPPLPIFFGVTVPLAAFFAAYGLSRSFRELVLAADLRLLAAVQAWRAGGLGFLALYVHGVLPGLFAWPAGLGDMAIGASAPLIAAALVRGGEFAGTRRFVSWNLFGILDLVVAVSLGTLSAGMLPQLTGGVTTAPMASMPLVLIPAFLVPLFLILHLMALMQARRQAARAAIFEPAGA